MRLSLRDLLHCYPRHLNCWYLDVKARQLVPCSQRVFILPLIFRSLFTAVFTVVVWKKTTTVKTAVKRLQKRSGKIKNLASRVANLLLVSIIFLTSQQVCYWCKDQNNRWLKLNDSPGKKRCHHLNSSHVLPWDTINPLMPNIDIHILLTILLIFLMLLVGRIWLKIKTFDHGWSFSLFSWPVCLNKY